MSELKQTMQRAREFIAANLAECCRDELDWQKSSILRDGKLREAAAIFGEVDKTHAIPMAQSETARQAMQLACRTQPEATKPAQDLQLVVATSTETGFFHVVINVNDGKRSLVLYDKQHSLNGDTVGVADIPAAALASPADALSAPIRTDIELARKEGRITFSGVLPPQHTFGPTKDVSTAVFVRASNIDSPEFIALLDDYARNGNDGYEECYKRILAYISARIPSPADALVEGDSETAKDATSTQEADIAVSVKTRVTNFGVGGAILVKDVHRIIDEEMHAVSAARKAKENGNG